MLQAHQCLEREQLSHVKLSVLGAYATGKTSLIERTLGGSFSEKWRSTERLQAHHSKVVFRHQALRLTLWDHPGFDQYTDIQAPAVGGHGLILVADGTRAQTVQWALHLLQQLESNYGPKPTVLVVNKADLKESPQWQVGQQLCLPMPVLFTSAKDPLALTLAVQHLAGRALPAGSQNPIQHLAGCAL